MNIRTAETSIPALLRCSPLFSGLPDEAIDRLASESRVKFYSKGSHLYRINEFSTDIFCLLSGRVRISVRGATGQQFALTDLGPKEWLGEGAVLDNERRVVESMVIEEADVLVLPWPEILAVAEQFPLIYRNLFEQSQVRARSTYQLLGYVLFLPLRARVAGRLLQLFDKSGDGCGEFPSVRAQINQKDLSQLSLGSRQHINKIFRDWNREGVVKKVGDRYELLDITALRREVTVETGL